MINPALQIEDIDFDEEDEDTFFGNNVKVLLQDMDLIKWRQDLCYDKEKLELLLSAAKGVTPERDAKLLELKNLIKEKIEKPINPGNRKVIIFTAFADTANYLYEHLAEPLREMGLYSALVTGSGNNRSTCLYLKNCEAR